MFGPCGRRRELLIERWLPSQTDALESAHASGQCFFSFRRGRSGDPYRGTHAEYARERSHKLPKWCRVYFAGPRILLLRVFRRRIQRRLAVGTSLQICECTRLPPVSNSRFHGVAFLLLFLPPPRRRGLSCGGPAHVGLVAPCDRPSRPRPVASNVQTTGQSEPSAAAEMQLKTITEVPNWVNETPRLIGGVVLLVARLAARPKD